MSNVCDAPISSKEEAKEILYREGEAGLWASELIMDKSSPDNPSVRVDGIITRRGVQAMLFLMDDAVKEARRSG